MGLEAQGALLSAIGWPSAAACAASVAAAASFCPRPPGAVLVLVLAPPPAPPQHQMKGLGLGHSRLSAVWTKRSLLPRRLAAAVIETASLHSAEASSLD